MTIVRTGPIELPIEQIRVGKRIRPLSHVRVSEIAASIARHGQFHAVQVVKKGDVWLLLAGWHRLEAVKQLGHPKILAQPVSSDQTAAALGLIEIEENWCREDLSPLDRALTIRHWKERWEKLNPDLAIKTKKGYAGAIARWVQPIDLVGENANRNFPFASELAEQLGKSRSLIEKALKLAELEDDSETLKALRALPKPPKQSELQALHRHHDKRAKVLAVLAADPSCTLGRALKQVVKPGKASPAARVKILWFSLASKKQKREAFGLLLDDPAFRDLVAEGRR